MGLLGLSRNQLFLVMKGAWAWSECGRAMCSPYLLQFRVVVGSVVVVVLQHPAVALQTAAL